MNSTHLQWSSIASLVITGLGMGGVLIIVWIGWLRTRRSAYLVLAAWALVTMLGVAAQSVVLPQLQMRFGANTSFPIFMVFQLARSFVTLVLLLLGLGMLVFGERSPAGER
jgi:hypothetical protein